MVERVVLNRCGDDFAFVTLRLPDVNLSGIRARRDRLGNVTLTAPTEERNGRRWPLFALQPGTAEAARIAVAQVWARAEGRG